MKIKRRKQETTAQTTAYPATHANAPFVDALHSILTTQATLTAAGPHDGLTLANTTQLDAEITTRKCAVFDRSRAAAAGRLLQRTYGLCWKTAASQTLPIDAAFCSIKQPSKGRQSCSYVIPACVMYNNNNPRSHLQLSGSRNTPSRQFID
jgi:hypothetical protein